ncbi:hypothetical protein OOT46_03035 [Aquabacterium sp. A7-Y]|uniref:hypothetical protein n=1 Tax=Aquabacterium sp. A7-Y TaxID=1349605 RepID=UPI00223DA8AA|nr:hypothetical protein [Aquabacterium sp. A7-Y]MCW7536828.1 hypothetical protein [Aquabacterium sp. A7-Y]
MPFIRQGGADLVLYQVTKTETLDAIVAELRRVQQAEHLPGVRLTAYYGPHGNRGEVAREVMIE